MDGYPIGILNKIKIFQIFLFIKGLNLYDKIPIHDDSNNFNEIPKIIGILLVFGINNEFELDYLLKLSKTIKN